MHRVGLRSLFEHLALCRAVTLMKMSADFWVQSQCYFIFDLEFSRTLDYFFFLAIAIQERALLI